MRVKNMIYILVITLIICCLTFSSCAVSNMPLSTTVPTILPPSPSTTTAGPTILYDTGTGPTNTPITQSPLVTQTPTDTPPMQTEVPVPHLEIVDVAAEPIPWIKELSQTGQMVCDYFRIKLIFTIMNKGGADFPPEGVTASIGTGGIFFFTILYRDGDEWQEDENSQTRVLQEAQYYTFWYHNELNVPAGGTTQLERVFRVAYQYPLNPFQVVAWFTEPMWRLEPGRIIPPPDTPVIEQMYSFPDGKRISLKLDGTPFMSIPIDVHGPDVRPVQAVYIPVPGEARRFDTCLIFENIGELSAEKVYASLKVPDTISSNNSIQWTQEVTGPFAPGMHAVFVCNQFVSGVPDYTKSELYITLLCPEDSPGVVSVGDVDMSNDLKLIEQTKEQSKESLADILARCISVHRFGDCDPALGLD